MPVEKMERFTVKPIHLQLIKRFYISWNECEFGAPTIDPKRPFGNSDVKNDFEKITGEKFDATTYYYDLETCLQILTRNLHIEEGTYEKYGYGIDWVKVD